MLGGELNIFSGVTRLLALALAEYLILNTLGETVCVTPWNRRGHPNKAVFFFLAVITVTLLPTGKSRQASTLEVACLAITLPPSRNLLSGKNEECKLRHGPAGFAADGHPTHKRLLRLGVRQ